MYFPGVTKQMKQVPKVVMSGKHQMKQTYIRTTQLNTSKPADRHWIMCATPSYPSPRPCGPPWPWTVMKTNHNQLSGNKPRPMGQLKDRSRQLDQGVNIYTRAGSNMRQEEKNFCAQKIFRLLLKRSESWLNIRHASTSTVEPPRWQQDTNNMVQMWEACCFFKNEFIK